MGRKKRLPLASIEALEEILAALDAADEAARVLALRAWNRPDDLIEADTIRVKLGLIWKIVHRERQSYESPAKGKKKGDRDAADE